MPPPIDLLRHGHTDITGRYLGRTDAPLSEAGWQQMRSAISDAAGWRRIVSSPSQRCAAFAHELAEARQLPIEIDARWREMNFGAWENRLTSEIMESDPDRLRCFWENPLHHSPPGGESLAGVAARVLAAWKDLAARREPALVISHGGPIRILLCLAQQRPLARLLDIDAPHASLHRPVLPPDIALP